ncbi:hypothetical protein [Streptomyces lydicus]|uniref:hypothetical protein n=1 Tax=Streptomyces lydicus TaxID=47763 RepID=UPI0037D0380E
MRSDERIATRVPPPGLRLLPWESDTGKPCFLSADDVGSRLARLADAVEAEQLCDGADVAKGAQAVLDDRNAGEHALRLALRAATQALVAVVRVADSRGARLPVPDEGEDADDAEGEGPQIPAEAGG